MNREPEVIHEVDGIQEYDNHLPMWWLYTLYGAVLFSIFYWFHYHVFQTGEHQGATYRRELLEQREKQGAPVSAAMLTELSRDSKTLGAGTEVYTTNCVPCHGPTGGGTIGPNLTDGYWLHGGTPESIFASIRDGFADKGMPAWGAQLGERRALAVTAYVLSLRNTNAPGGKPPQGDKVD